MFDFSLRPWWEKRPDLPNYTLTDGERSDSWLWADRYRDWLAARTGRTAKTVRELDKKRDWQAWSKGAEIAQGRILGSDVEGEVNLNPYNPVRHWDVREPRLGLKLDVKFSLNGARCAIWPYTKLKQLAESDADILTLMLGDLEQWTLQYAGWIPLWAFRKHMRTAEKGDGTGLDAGTPFVPRAWLFHPDVPMDQIELISSS